MRKCFASGLCHPISVYLVRIAPPGSGTSLAPAIASRLPRRGRLRRPLLRLLFRGITVSETDGLRPLRPLRAGVDERGFEVLRGWRTTNMILQIALSTKEMSVWSSGITHTVSE